jgi:hypothetical protein
MQHCSFNINSGSYGVEKFPSIPLSQRGNVSLFHSGVNVRQVHALYFD